MGKGPGLLASPILTAEWGSANGLAQTCVRVPIHQSKQIILRGQCGLGDDRCIRFATLGTFGGALLALTL